MCRRRETEHGWTEVLYLNGMAAGAVALVLGTVVVVEARLAC